jgi:hypothetical protein
MKCEPTDNLQILSTTPESNFQVNEEHYTAPVRNSGFWINFFDLIKFIISLILGLGLVILVNPFGWIGMVIVAVIWKFIIS